MIRVTQTFNFFGRTKKRTYPVSTYMYKLEGGRLYHWAGEIEETDRHGIHQGIKLLCWRRIDGRKLVDKRNAALVPEREKCSKCAVILRNGEVAE